MGLGTAIDLRRFARPGATVIAETSAGLTVRLTFGGVARGSATAAVTPGLVRAGDELGVCLGPPTVRLAAAFEVVTVGGGDHVDTVTLVVRQGAVVAGAIRAALPGIQLEPITTIGAVVGAHAGPGTVGVAFGPDPLPD